VGCFEEAEDELLPYPKDSRLVEGGYESRFLLSLFSLAWLSRTFVLRSSFCTEPLVKLYRAGLRSGARRWPASESVSESSKTSFLLVRGDGAPS
jgi:hypothetical protein